jgi:predicted ester cyclase
MQQGKRRTTMSAVQSAPQPSPATTSLTAVEEQNLALFRTVIDEAFTKGNLDVLDTLISDDLQEHQFFGPDHPRGVEGVKATVRDLHRLLSGFTLTIQDITVSGDTVWGRMIGEGIHQGEFFGITDTGKRVKVDVIDICRFKDGKMVEHWGVPDRFHLMIQLGMLPASQLRPASSPN